MKRPIMLKVKNEFNLGQQKLLRLLRHLSVWFKRVCWPSKREGIIIIVAYLVLVGLFLIVMPGNPRITTTETFEIVERPPGYVVDEWVLTVYGTSRDLEIRPQENQIPCKLLIHGFGANIKPELQYQKEGVNVTMLLENEMEIEIDPSKLKHDSNIAMEFRGNEVFYTGLSIFQPYRIEVFQLVVGGWYAKDAIEKQNIRNLSRNKIWVVVPPYLEIGKIFPQPASIIVDSDGSREILFQNISYPSTIYIETKRDLSPVAGGVILFLTFGIWLIILTEKLSTRIGKGLIYFALIAASFFLIFIIAIALS